MISGLQLVLWISDDKRASNQHLSFASILNWGIIANSLIEELPRFGVPTQYLVLSIGHMSCPLILLEQPCQGLYRRAWR
jgi:hypothetical protein